MRMRHIPFGYTLVLTLAQDVFKTQKQIEAAGGKIVREAGAIPGLGTKIVRPHSQSRCAIYVPGTNTLLPKRGASL